MDIELTLKSRIPAFFILLFFVSGCCPHADKKEVYQVSTIGALMRGVYDGAVECGQLRKKGDFGIGTFDGLDGELVEMEGKIYRVRTDGIAYRVPDTEKVPFAVNTFFRADRSVIVPPGLNYSAVQTYLDSLLPGKNRIYAVRITGEFSSMKTRSVPKYKKPYPPLSEAVKNQKVFEFKNVRGTMVGFRFPAYLEGVNVAGYHLHFLTEDKKAGGHVLDFKSGSLNASLEEGRSFALEFPEGADFRRADLSTTAAAIGTVEREPVARLKK